MKIATRSLVYRVDWYVGTVISEQLAAPIFRVDQSRL